MTTSTIGSVMTVSIVIAGASLAMVGFNTPTEPVPDLHIRWLPVGTGQPGEDIGYQASVEHIHGADVVDASVVWNGTRQTAELEKGDEVYLPCPADGGGVAFVVDDERGPWSTMPACGPDDGLRGPPSADADPAPDPTVDPCEALTVEHDADQDGVYAHAEVCLLGVEATATAEVDP